MVDYFVKIKKIVKTNKSEKMVDLTVEDNGNFVLANGICVCNSAMIDLNVLRLADILLLKEPSLLQSDFERKILKDIYKKITPLFNRLENKNSYFYIYADDFQGLLNFEIPEFWNDSISKSFG